MWRAHLSQNFVQPLQRSVKMNLNPAGGARDILAMILGSPTLNKTHPDSAHLGELIDDFKAMVDWLSQQLGKELVVEDLEAAATGDLADSGWVEAVLIVAVPALYKDAAVTHALGVDLSPDIVQMHALSYVSPGIFYCWVSVDIRKKSKTESVPVIWRVCESIYKHASGGSLECLPNSVV